MIQINTKTNITIQTINKDSNHLTINFIIVNIEIDMVWKSYAFQTYLKDDMIQKEINIKKLGKIFY